MSRIAQRFARLKADKRSGLVTYVTAGDPNPELSYQILKGLPAAGADLIELGMPFTDPMADGPSIQLAGQRALKAGITVDATFDNGGTPSDPSDDEPFAFDFLRSSGPDIDLCANLIRTIG